MWLGRRRCGVTGQIITRTDHYPGRSSPSILTEPIDNKDAEKSERVVKAMMQMVKIDIEALKRAYADK
jgi:predicted 3-demethylubiquinone-9 3-methyltransferase (glyoxalase superfamily)